jgi:hypothetical protein
MATYAKINDWVDYLGEDVDLATDTLKAVLSNTAPASETSNPTADGNGVLSNVTQIAGGNGYTTGGNALSGVTYAQTGGVGKLDATDLVITASGGAMGTWRYVYLVDDTVAAKPLIGVWDVGSAVSLGDGDSRTLVWNASGIMTVTAS